MKVSFSIGLDLCHLTFLIDCIPDCEKCSNSQTCETCSDGYGLLDSRCVNCHTGMYLSSDGECLGIDS